MSGQWAEIGEQVFRVVCPSCSRYTVVYNGNYFCAAKDCKWSMDGRHTATNDAIMHAYLTQRMNAANKAGRGEELALLRQHLRVVEQRQRARARKASGLPRKIGGRVKPRDTT